MGIVDELDLPGNPLFSAMYEVLTAIVNMLPLVAAFLAILSKVMVRVRGRGRVRLRVRVRLRLRLRVRLRVRVRVS